MAYWNEELETLPWPEVERWQAAQVAAALGRIRSSSGLYARLHQGLPEAPRLATLADLQALPFTFKDDLRAAQEAADDALSEIESHKEREQEIKSELKEIAPDFHRYAMFLY